MHMLVGIPLSELHAEHNLAQYQVPVDYGIVFSEASGIEVILLQAHLQNAMQQMICELLLVIRFIILKMLVVHGQMLV